MGQRGKTLLHWLGVDMIHVGHAERLIAAAGALIGIACCWNVSLYFVGHESATLIIASVGAGAVLLFGVPHGALSQPWPATGGHLLSAIVGVSCARWIEPTWLAGSVAVGLAVLVMHYARCLHPPGGATALIAVVGGQDIHALGYAYVLEPVMLNALILLCVALLFNNLVASRSYPAAWVRAVAKPSQVSASGRIMPEHVRAALAEMDMVEDISEEDLLVIITRAEFYASGQGKPAEHVKQ
ncbi:HPP family protein [Mariprofundus ferrooxydans]|uniref:HPP family protein n=1 Tax=Mariprofundus ferrooxydans TaxID=314344 RepID=UPI00142FBA3D|nr:HPP family protein [Mariprofundus ferrooxydans]